MIKNLKLTIILSALFFSVYCFCFLQSQEALNTQTATETSITIETKSEKEDSKMFLPDLAILEKVSNLITAVSKVF